MRQQTAIVERVVSDAAHPRNNIQVSLAPCIVQGYRVLLMNVCLFFNFSSQIEDNFPRPALTEAASLHDCCFTKLQLKLD